MTCVGVAGLGRMGAPMAYNLATAGFDVALWNRSASKAEVLAAEIGAEVCASPRELAESTDTVITMLADDEASRAVHYGDGGLFAAAGGTTHFLEMGTLSPAHVLALADSADGRTVIDAPVSGSTDAARSAQLTIMVGAEESAIAGIRSVLEALSRRIVCLGGTGRGATMKLAVNLLIHGMNQTVSEAILLAEASGIPAEAAYGVIEESAAAAPMLRYRKPQYLDEAACEVSFALSLARKDVNLALDLARAVDVTMPQAEVNVGQLLAAESAGFGRRDMAAMLNYLRGSAS